MKKCTKCLEVKPLDDFYFKSKLKGLRHNTCKACQKGFSQVHYAKNRANYYANRDKQRKLLKAYILDVRKSSKCLRCGESRWYVLDFHHRDPKEKDDNITNLVYCSGSKKRIDAEIAKCDILCANCHREIHYYIDENKR